MSEYLHFEAEESDDDTELTKEEKRRLKKISREKDDYEDDDREVDDMSDFINDDDEIDVSKNINKRKRHVDFDDRLEDEDFDLIEENVGLRLQRNNYKRVRRIQEDNESDDEGQNGGVLDDRAAIANELFSGSDDNEQVQVRPVNDRYQDLSDSGDEYSDNDGFIVDDDGAPISRPKLPRRRRRGLNDAVLKEAQDIFGTEFDYNDLNLDNDELGEDENVDEQQNLKSKSIYEVYEPCELEKAHLTEKDNEIRHADIPERFQFRGTPVTPTDGFELEIEAEWIQKHAFSTPTISIQDQVSVPDLDEFGEPILPTPKLRSKDKIRNVLNFIRNEFLEVPFIAFYRKEYVEPDLNIDDLWTIYKWDERWCQLQITRRNLSHLIENMRKYQRDCAKKNQISDETRIIPDNDINRLDSMQTIDELRDSYRCFSLYYGHEISNMHYFIKNKNNEIQDGDNDVYLSKNLKKAIRRDNYSVILRTGIGDFVSKFGLTPEEFGENIRDNYTRHEVDQYPIEPLELAKDYVCRQFPTPHDVLKAAKFVVATRLSHEPLVRQCVRSTFFERATLSLKPTKNGMKIIDENHPCYTFKFLKNKPVKDLKDEQFLLIHIAEEEGFLKTSIGLKNQDSMVPDVYLDEIKQLYYKDEFNQIAQDWNAQRSSVLELMLNFLYPIFEKELTLKLLNEAKKCVITSCCDKLNRWLKVAPHRATRVMAIAYVPDRDQCAFSVFLDTDGNVVDFLKLANLLNRQNPRYPRDRDAKREDLESISDFIDKHRPDVVVVGGECRDALMIIEDLKRIIDDLEQSTDMSYIPVELIDNDLATVYMRSKKSETDFIDYPPLLRQAISLGRRLQDPLTEFCQLCTKEEDFLCLKYHPLQNHVDKDELLECLYQEFINRTNEVGVDVNRVLIHPHTSSLLQFVGGLGPRKSAHVLKVVKQTIRRLENRSQLIKHVKMGKVVFFNCAGFIKIDVNSLSERTETHLEVLDSTRIHPQAYECARQMAQDALIDEDICPSTAVEDIFDKSEKLNDLNLEDFNEELQKQDRKDRSITLYDIRSELTHPYKDFRTSYRLDSVDKFNILTKETPTTFFVGKLVMATVTGIARLRPKTDSLDRAEPIRNDETALWQCPFCLQKDFCEVQDVWNHFDSSECPGKAVGVRTRLDNGLFGFILTRNISDKFVTNPEDRVRIGMSLHCRITKIDVERFQVDLTCKTSDLVDEKGEWRPTKDNYYDYEAETKDNAKNVKKSDALPKYTRRVIVHPAFQNIDYTQALKLMSTLEQGDVVVRPSSKSSDHLTCTWKVTDAIYQHIDIRETDKVNSYSLGHSLFINNEEFEDLDEIIARHVQPMASFARDLLKFQYYKDTKGGKKEVAEKLIMEEKQKHPNKINYFVTASKEFPGKFVLYYLPRNKVCAEYISIIPDGFRFRQKVFQSPTALIRWFKEHFRDKIPGTPSSTLISRTPITATPNFNVNSINPQILKRAAANIPNHVFNTLSQVANQTPLLGYQHTPLQIQTPAMTPADFVPPLPRQLPSPMTLLPPLPVQSIPTPGYQSSPLIQTPTQQWIYPNPIPRLPPPRPVVQRYSNPVGIDWAKAAAVWAQQNQLQQNGDKPPGC